MEVIEQAFVQKLQRDLNCLSDPDRSTRKRAIERLQKRLLNGDPGEGAPSPGVIQAAWDDVILRLLLRTLSDPVEKCRELGIQLIKSAVKVVPQVGKTMALVVPSVAERMGQSPVLEESEEIRLLLVQLTVAILSADYPADECHAVADPLVKFLIAALADPFHEIKKGVCKAVVLISTRSPKTFEGKTEPLLRALLLNITHTHSRVRLAVLQAVDELVIFGLPAGTVSSLLAPSVKSLAFDRSLSVREAFYPAVARWLGYADQPSTEKVIFTIQKKDLTVNIPYLLPLLLLGITDESTDLAGASLSLVEGVGRVYEENAFLRNPSSDNMMVDTEEEMTLRGLTGVGDCLMVDIEGRKDADFPYYLLGAPYKGRPSAGCRSMVQNHLKDMLRPTTRDLREWKNLARVGAARLAHTLTVFAETSATDCLDTLLPAFISAVSDDDVAVAQQVIAAVQALGFYVRAENWLPFVLDSVTDSRSSEALRANGLVVLAGLLFGTPKHTLPNELVLQLSSGLCQADVRCSDHPAVRRQLLAVVTNLLNAAETISSPSALNLFLTLLQLQSVEEDAQLQMGASEIIESLSKKLGLTSVKNLHEKFLEDLIPLVTAGYEEWLGISSGRALFQTFMKKSGSTVGPYLKSVVNMFIVCLHHDRDPVLRISFLQLLDEMFENQALGPSWIPLSEQIILELLIPCGVWRIGKVAAAIRHRAMVALGTFLRQDFCTQASMLELIKPEKQFLSVVKSCLDEDYYVDTRRATCHVIQHVIRIAGAQMADEQRITVSLEIQKRLDDSSDIVRLEIVPAIATFFQTLRSSSSDEDVKSLLSNLLVHMDDSNKKIQAAVCVAAQACATQRPKLVIDLATKICKDHRTSTYFDELQSFALSIESVLSSETPHCV
ncbi:hypothetical protein Mapa_004407 [Marchantia paleacea]|nr:hypothetical protein Mapa_004407 [Marchantia paleacea]